MPALLPGYQIPSSVRGELGYEWVELPANPGAHNAFTYTVPGDWWIVLQTVYCNVTSTGGGSTLLAILQVANASGVVIDEMPAPLTQTGLSPLIWTYRWSNAITAPFPLDITEGATRVIVSAPLTTDILPSGYSLTLTADTLSLATFTSIAISVQRFPTGGDTVSVPTTVTPTPITTTVLEQGPQASGAQAS